MGNQIELIEKLYAKKKTYKIPKEAKEGIEQISIEVTPLALEDMGCLSMREEMNFSEISKNMKTMFAKSLEIEEEEAAKISFEYMEDLLAAIMDANNFKEEDIKKIGIKDFIKKKQEQIKEKKEKEDATESDRPA